MKLPLASLKAMLKENGAERISVEALEQYRLEVERYATALAEITVACTHHAGRKTVYADDIKLAIK